MNSELTRERAIRSFVRRTGRMTPSQQKALRELWPGFGIDYKQQLLDFNHVFEQPASLVVEIGFGNGETLVQQASENPERNFLGIEVHDPGIGHCLLQANKTGIRNLRVIKHDAVEVLTHQVADDSVARINIYFPDPWPKKRHHKRRIIQKQLLEMLAGKLRAGGTLNIATDWADYAEHIDEHFSGSAHFSCSERRVHSGDRPLDRPSTKFERRGLKKGHRIYDWCFARRAKP